MAVVLYDLYQYRFVCEQIVAPARRSLTPHNSSSAQLWVALRPGINGTPGLPEVWGWIGLTTGRRRCAVRDKT